MDKQGIENIRAHKAVRKWDAVVLLLFVAALIGLIVFALMPKGNYIEVYDAGELVYRLQMTDYGKYNIGDKLVVVVDKDGVMVEHAVCRDKLCEKQGHINTNGASIVCLPSKITVVIKGDTGGVDVVT